MVHVSVDSARCQGHARCYAFAPDIFDFDDEGYAFIPESKSDYDEMPEELRLAVANCPERAIIVEGGPPQ